MPSTAAAPPASSPKPAEAECVGDGGGVKCTVTSSGGCATSCCDDPWEGSVGNGGFPCVAATSAAAAAAAATDGPAPATTRSGRGGDASSARGLALPGGDCHAMGCCAAGRDRLTTECDVAGRLDEVSRRGNAGDLEGDDDDDDSDDAAVAGRCMPSTAALAPADCSVMRWPDNPAPSGASAAAAATVPSEEPPRAREPLPDRPHGVRDAAGFQLPEVFTPRAGAVVEGAAAATPVLLEVPPPPPPCVRRLCLEVSRRTNPG